MTQTPDIILQCDLCFTRQIKSDLDDPNVIYVGSWHRRNGKDICPGCAATISVAIDLGLVKGEKFEVANSASNDAVFLD